MGWEQALKDKPASRRGQVVRVTLTAREPDTGRQRLRLQIPLAIVSNKWDGHHAVRAFWGSDDHEGLLKLQPTEEYAKRGPWCEPELFSIKRTNEILITLVAPDWAPKDNRKGDVPAFQWADEDLILTVPNWLKGKPKPKQHPDNKPIAEREKDPSYITGNEKEFSEKKKIEEVARKFNASPPRLAPPSLTLPRPLNGTPRLAAGLNDHTFNGLSVNTNHGIIEYGLKAVKVDRIEALIMNDLLAAAGSLVYSNELRGHDPNLTRQGIENRIVTLQKQLVRLNAATLIMKDAGSGGYRLTKGD